MRRRLFCGRCNLSKAKKTPEQSGLCSDAARVFPVRHAHPAPSPAPQGAAAAKGRKARRRRRARVYKRAAAASGAFCGKGGARERGDGGFFAADASAKSKKDAGAKRTLLRRGARFSGAARTPRPIPRAARRGTAKGRKARRRRRARVYKRAAAASGAFCGKGGARERGDGGFFAADAICQKQKRRRSKADFAPTWWRRHPESNRGMRILQTLALPLGYVAEDGAGDGARTRHLSLGKAALYQMSYSRRSAARAAG